MFNTEKLLGGLLMGSNRRGSLNRLASGGIGLGLLGVAMEAAEHFMNKTRKTQVSAPPPAPPAGDRSTTASPPSVPGSAPPIPPTPPPEPKTYTSPENGVLKSQNSLTDSDAVLLIRAMIAAANADGFIDAKEKRRILKRFQTLDLSELEHTFIAGELSSPANLDQIVSQVESPEIAVQIYAVSLMAIDVDTDTEHRYMDGLARRLDIDNEKQRWIHEKLGISPTDVYKIHTL